MIESGLESARWMVDPAELLIDAAMERLSDAWRRAYQDGEPGLQALQQSECRARLEDVARGDALYHDLHHTVMVTLAGQAILDGKAALGEPVGPRERLHFTLALVLHDVGMVGGVCTADGDGVRATGVADGTVRPPRGATDAWLAPYHVDRAQIYVSERYGRHETLDAALLSDCIERTRFPVPPDDAARATGDLPGLVRAADLIGQLADPSRRRRLPALFYEFEETGANRALGFTSLADLEADYPRFFRVEVLPYIGEAMRHLRATPAGEPWLAGLRSALPEADWIAVTDSPE